MDGDPDEDAPTRAEATVYPDTVEALEQALEACRLVADGETVDAGDRDRFVKARTNLRVLKRELEEASGGR
ncbi:MAG: hypothetical protein ABEJ46_04575 [Gemmatimonadota bacterium]